MQTDSGLTSRPVAPLWAWSMNPISRCVPAYSGGARMDDWLANMSDCGISRHYLTRRLGMCAWSRRRVGYPL
jgi:hypothetical protein